MPNVARVLKEEIQRLARKEVMALFGPMHKQVQALKQVARDHKLLIRKLEDDLAQMQSAAQIQKKLEAGDIEAARKARITPASIKSHRLRLKLSQQELGKLLEVSPNSVVLWEAGKSVPRPAYRAKLAGLRKLGRKDVERLLEGR